MANKVIADLTALTGVASNDALPISDTSDASEAKKVTVAELFTNTVITTPTVNGGVLANNTVHNPTPTGNWDGWTWATDTWTAVDANTVSINADFTATLQLGDKLKLINDSTTKYFYIITTPAWSGTATTFDVTGEVDLVAGSITPRYSHQASPFGFKVAMPYASTLTNLTLGNGTKTSTITIIGNHVTVNFTLIFGSTTSITAPYPSFSFPVNIIGVHTASYLDSTVQRYIGIGIPGGVVSGGSTVLLTAQSVSGGNVVEAGVTSTIPFTWGTNDSMSVIVTGKIV